MRRALAAAALVALLSLVLVGIASADKPTEFQVVQSFVDVNPCTGELHTVTISINVSGHFHNGRFVGRGDRTITTSPTGFIGRGTDSVVYNGQVLKITLNDVLENDAGDRIRAHFVLLLDLSSGSPTVKVEKGFLKCLGK